MDIILIVLNNQMLLLLTKTTPLNPEALIKFRMCGSKDSPLKQSYPYSSGSKKNSTLEMDANRVWNYFNSGDIPGQFTANKRVVKVWLNDVDGSLYVQVGYPK
ncbi:hypothetical protein [Bacillus smithii]|uniref:hypothetical protein n=1 Tax=Bacillus smithii TaxID=1479 RepID=UPI002E2314C0|nr:hypothetical protein [Bacillus smithii]MED1457087.1 hypothetical protein [Bacillus smithii]